MKYLKFLIKYCIDVVWYFTFYLISKVYAQSSLIEYVNYFYVYIYACHFRVIFRNPIKTQTLCVTLVLMSKWVAKLISYNEHIVWLCIHCMPCILPKLFACYYFYCTVGQYLHAANVICWTQPTLNILNFISFILHRLILQTIYLNYHFTHMSTYFIIPWKTHKKHSFNPVNIINHVNVMHLGFGICNIKSVSS